MPLYPLMAARDASKTFRLCSQLIRLWRQPDSAEDGIDAPRSASMRQPNYSVNIIAASSLRYLAGNDLAAVFQCLRPLSESEKSICGRHPCFRYKYLERPSAHNLRRRRTEPRLYLRGQCCRSANLLAARAPRANGETINTFAVSASLSTKLYG